MNFYATFYTFLNLHSIIYSEVVSDGDKDVRERGNKKYVSNANKLHRRFLEDLDDDEWHVSHLKDVDFWSRKSSCKGQTFDEKVREYKRMLKNDGALVDYVSADPLPFNETDLTLETCKVQDGHLQDDLNAEKNGTRGEELFSKVGEKYENASVTEQVETATIVDGRQTLAEMDKVRNATSKEKGRRASEYMFSSAEYYDEVDDFDETWCPAMVEVITLELDQLRNYEVECEAIIEWHSLE